MKWTDKLCITYKRNADAPKIFQHYSLKIFNNISYWQDIAFHIGDKVTAKLKHAEKWNKFVQRVKLWKELQFETVMNNHRKFGGGRWCNFGLDGDQWDKYEGKWIANTVLRLCNACASVKVVFFYVYARLLYNNERLKFGSHMKGGWMS